MVDVRDVVDGRGVRRFRRLVRGGFRSGGLLMLFRWGGRFAAFRTRGREGRSSEGDTRDRRDCEFEDLLVHITPCLSGLLALTPS